MKRCAGLIVGLVLLNCAWGAEEEHPGQAPAIGTLLSKRLVVFTVPGKPGVDLDFNSEPLKSVAVLALVPSRGGEAQGIRYVRSGSDGRKRLFQVTAGTAEANLSLESDIFLKVTPLREASALEIRADARYVVLPDFFANDVVFNPEHISASKLTVPAENFLLQFVAGGDAILMCIWPGNMEQPGAKRDEGTAKRAPDPQVDLIFSGEGKNRRVSATRIEFQGKPVYVGVIERKGIWHEEDVSAMGAYKPGAIAWRRPVEARWRGDFVLAPGKTLNDWPGTSQSFDFQNTETARTDTWWKREADPLDAKFAAAASNSNPLKWIERGDANAPQIWQESLAAFFIYPAVFKGAETRLCLYADKAARNKAKQATDAARKADKAAAEVPPPNVYESVLIYPIGRVPATPLDLYTPVDLMRETLGAGPCEYILDLAGVKPRPAGGDRPLLSFATCGLWNDHISPLLKKLKKKADGSFEPLDEKDKAHLIQALEEMWYFVHSVHDRLREYKAWGAGVAAYCDREVAAKAALKPIAEKVMASVARLNADVGKHKFEGPGSEAYWKDRIPELVKLVRDDNYAGVDGIGKIRDLGNDQDERVSRCRQYVKAARQEVLLQDTSDADVRAFVGEIRDRCHNMLRNMHPKEGF